MTAPPPSTSFPCGALLLATVLYCTLPRSVDAQERERARWLIGAGSTVGALQPLGNRWLLRVDVAAYGGVTSVKGDTQDRYTSSWTLSPGLGVWRFLGDSGVLRRYWSARLGYSRTASSNANLTSAVSLGLAFGVHWQAEDRFGIAAQVGANLGAAQFKVDRKTFYDKFTDTYVSGNWGTAASLGVTLRRRRPD